MHRPANTTIFAYTTLAIALAWTPVAWAQSHEHGEKEAPERVGDAYPLNVDPVTGVKLADIDQPVVLLHEGRELRFASEENAEQFKADPDAYLPKVDQLIIEQQTPLYPLDTCVVSGEKLGGDMGEPIDFVFGNRLVRFCCSMCVGTFEKNPAKYLEKINAAVIEKQQADYPLTTCLVSGEKLGEMGEPIDYVSGNRLARFCCPRCVKTFEKNPAHYLVILHRASEHAHGEHGEHKEHDDND
ncbi:MAG: hypothetical protein IT445_04955 [Phycisphaeraceae bacterium]|nr:hypothetical protein [Phycisphaeraceae bacterium]